MARCTIPAVIVAGLALLSASDTRACNTPVYRYAMYNWAPAPFFVFYFHHGETPAEDEEVNKLITDLAESGPALANLLLEPIDVSAGEIEKLPKPVKEAWQAYVGEAAEKAQPAHLVFTSWGAKLHAGRLDQATVRALVDSPLRSKIGDLLEDGCAAVMVLLPGSNAEENKQAEKTARDIVTQAAAGKIPVESGFLDASMSQPMPPTERAEEDPAEETLSEEARIAAASRLKMGLVKVDRSDEAEKWLVRSLMAMEDDLEELTEHPMIFFAYGRCRAMPPYVGKGINAENLTAEIQFLASACSCFVKDQNPGADLPMHWDWEATADAMAAKDPSMSGGPLAYEEFSPDDSGNMVASTEPGATAEVAAAVAGSPSGTDETASTDPDATDAGVAAPEEQPQAGSELSASQAPSGTPAVTVTLPEPEQVTSFASRQMWTLGIGLVVVAVIVLGAGSVLIVKRATPGGRPVP
ncbi:MAG TPA: hypothetical protein VMY37_23470 [Thermoguttaceae bacterium]|nr:hypothetical protein [Thermoguttaceae bacterium]